ncbi:MAG: DsrE family protein [Firmicutes bacterium]|nr:DsrE family protein [Bacillota bacterium]
MVRERFLVNLTRSPESDPDRVTVAFVMARSALTLDKDTVVLLSTDGVWAGVPAYYAKVHEDGFPPLADIIHGFLEEGGQLWACAPCVVKRGLADQLHPRVQLVGAVTAIAWVSENGVSFSF